MILSELIPLVSKIAPMIATALGGPLAGMALELIGGAYSLVKDGKAHNLQSIADAISAEPTKLKELEYQHQEALATILEKLAADTSSRAPDWLVGLGFLVAIVALGAMIVYVTMFV